LAGAILSVERIVSFPCDTLADATLSDSDLPGEIDLQLRPSRVHSLEMALNHFEVARAVQCQELRLVGAPRPWGGRHDRDTIPSVDQLDPTGPKIDMMF
jgi:hypothetical protein